MKKRIGLAGAALAAGVMAMGAQMTAFAASVTKEQAQEIALKDAGIAAEDAAWILTKTDYEHGRLVYEVEFITKDYAEYDYEISAESGAILSFDYDAEEYDGWREREYREYGWQDRGRREDRGYTGRMTEAAITEEEAKNTAIAHASLRAADVDFVKIELDWDDGRLLYEGELYSGIWEYEFEIDAASGRITEWESESRFD